MAILTVKDLNYSIKNKVLYIDASFDLNNGEHMGIVGRNGVGKSTLINMINGMVEVDNGLIQWGKNTRVGYLDQHAHIEGEITILNFLKKAFE
jgi:ATPase subunit of ABC transporter with duplicated ATPase domains